jgi:hypothetical protein
MWLLKSEGIGDANNEVAHGFWIHECFTPLRAAEAGEVDGDQMRGPGQSRPRLLEREQAFRPWVQQQGMLRTRPALREAD